MSMTQKLAVLFLAGIIGLCALEFGERLAVPGVHSFVSTAEAVIGRPLTRALATCMRGRDYSAG